MNSDPRELISTAPMSRLQVIAVAVTFILNALDGFDVLSISFASPGRLINPASCPPSMGAQSRCR